MWGLDTWLPWSVTELSVSVGWCLYIWKFRELQIPRNWKIESLSLPLGLQWVTILEIIKKKHQIASYLWIEITARRMCFPTLSWALWLCHLQYIRGSWSILYSCFGGLQFLYYFSVNTLKMLYSIFNSFYLSLMH